MSVAVYIMLSLMSVISPPPDLCGLSARTVVYVGTLGVFDLKVTLVGIIIVMTDSAPDLVRGIDIAMSEKTVDIAPNGKIY